MIYPDFVKMVEVGPRDGLQNESVEVPVPVRIDLINRLAAAGMLYANLNITKDTSFRAFDALIWETGLFNNGRFEHKFNFETTIAQ